MFIKPIRTLMLFVLLILSGCAYHQKIPFEKTKTLYQGQDANDILILRQTPFFLTHNSASTYNRIGRPSARYDDQGEEQIYVDTEHPVIYYLKRNFTTQKGQYTNLIYRVHFPKVPFSLFPFYIAAVKNVGLFVVITLDAAKRPVLVTTVGTCGCYMAIVPTTLLPRDARPLKWPDDSMDIYGERLPSRLNYANMKNPKLLIYLRPGVHRVMDIAVVDEGTIRKSPHFTIIPASLKPMQELDRIPIHNGTTSFYYNKGDYEKRLTEFEDQLIEDEEFGDTSGKILTEELHEVVRLNEINKRLKDEYGLDLTDCLLKAARAVSGESLPTKFEVRCEDEEEGRHDVQSQVVVAHQGEIFFEHPQVHAHEDRAQRLAGRV